MYEVVMNDFKQVYSFEVKGGEVVGPKIKFPKVVYDRVEAFNTEEAFENGWTYYGIMQLILGKLKKEECWFHPAIQALCPVKYTDQIDKNFRRLDCGIVPRSSRFCLCKRVWY